MPNARDLDLLSNNPVIGATVIADSLAAEDTLDITPTTLGEEKNIPILVALRARAQDIYVAQGDKSVALHTTAAQNLIIEAGATIYVVVTGADDGYIAFERVSADGVLAATVVGRVRSQ